MSEKILAQGEFYQYPVPHMPTLPVLGDEKKYNFTLSVVFFCLAALSAVLGFILTDLNIYEYSFVIGIGLGVLLLVLAIVILVHNINIKKTNEAIIDDYEYKKKIYDDDIRAINNVIAQNAIIKRQKLIVTDQKVYAKIIGYRDRWRTGPLNNNKMVIYPDDNVREYININNISGIEHIYSEKGEFTDDYLCSTYIIKAPELKANFYGLKNYTDITRAIFAAMNKNFNPSDYETTDDFFFEKKTAGVVVEESVIPAEIKKTAGGNSRFTSGEDPVVTACIKKAPVDNECASADVPVVPDAESVKAVSTEKTIPEAENGNNECTAAEEPVTPDVENRPVIKENECTADEKTVMPGDEAE